MTEVWITGIGLVSSLGEGLDAHFEALSATAPQPVVDEARFAPYPVHPVVRLELDKQIPRKADQRQMEPWQRLGTYAAGLALADAGITGNAELLSRMDMIVAAGGGERDVEVDSQILAGLETAADPDSFLNERLSNDLRPTLFLAQLSNLLAGNISIVHKVTGSSRTFMGEELAGVSAIEIATRRIASGQGEVFLIGAAYNAERIDVLLNLALGGHLWKGAHVPVWTREGEGGGLVTGSMSGFVVLESPEHARARGAKPYARLLSVLSDRSRRTPGAATENGRRAIETLKPLLGDRPVPVISGATGAAPITGEERDFLAGLREEGLVGPVRALTSLVGAGYDATFPVLVALAALSLARGAFYGSDDPTAFEGETGDAPERILVNCWGHWRGEGMALLAAAD